MLFFTKVTESCYTVLGIVYYLRELLKIALIIIPIGLIVMMSIDFVKGLINFNDDISKIFILVLRRIMYTMFIFLIPSTVFSLLYLVGATNRDSEKCWNYVNEISVSEVRKIVENREEALRIETNNMIGSLNEKYVKNMISDKLSNRKIISKNGKKDNSDQKNENSDALSSDQTVNEKTKIRLTSFSDYKVGTGFTKESKKISKNNKGWYVYSDKGKKYLVLAAATKELKRISGWGGYDPKVLFGYYDTLRIQVEGKVYDAIILDSCGACMKYSKSSGIKLDLWTSSESQNFGDWQYIVPYN